MRPLMLRCALGVTSALSPERCGGYRAVGMAAKPRSRGRTRARGRAAAAAAATPSAQRAPLTLYVAWHCDADDGEFLARQIYRWFRGDPYDLEACGTGIPVQFRAWHRGSVLREPLDLPRAGDGTRVLVLLVDEHFATCKEWRNYVHRLVGRARSKGGSDLIVFPVALHPGAFQLAGDVAALNFLRADGPGASPGEPIAARRERRAIRIRNQLTDALGRLLRAQNDGFHVEQFGRPPEKVSVFLSHAKADGAHIASTLRDEIQRRGQLDAFYDENDLAYGFDYHKGLGDALAHGNAILLAVLTDRYASRPWCRQELRAMRSVHAVQRPTARAAGVAKVAPVLVVDALEEQSLDHLPEIGTAPVLRWHPDRIGLIVDTAQRLVLQYAHDLQRAFDLADEVPRAERSTTWFVNGAPDVRLVAEMRRLMTGGGRARAPATLVFPGPGVTRDTIDDWQRLFPEVRLLPFDEVEVHA